MGDGGGRGGFFPSDQSFEFDALTRDQPPLEATGPADPETEARLLAGPTAFDLDLAPDRAPSAPRRRRASGARLNSSTGPAERHRRSATPRGPMAAAVGLVLAVGVALLAGTLEAEPGRTIQPAVVAVASPAAASVVPEPPPAVSASEPLPVANPPSPRALAEGPGPAPEAAPPPPPAEAPTPPPILSAEPEPAAEEMLAADAVPDCRAEVEAAAEACWRDRLADAERLLVAAHLNAREAGVPISDLRVGLDDWLDAQAAAEEEPQTRLGLYQERLERVDTVAAVHAEAEAEIPPGTPDPPPGPSALD